MEMDEMETLMPRTRAAKDQAPVDATGLKEYFEATKHGIRNTIGRRSGVIIRSDVRKDDQGFEDIDDFWAQDQSDDKEDEEDESTMMSSAVEDDEDDEEADDEEENRSIRLSISSISSQPIRMAASAAQQPTEDEDDGHDDSDTMDLDVVSLPSSSPKAKESSARLLALELAAKELAATKQPAEKEQSTMEPQPTNDESIDHPDAASVVNDDESVYKDYNRDASAAVKKDEEDPTSFVQENDNLFHSPASEKRKENSPPNSEKSTHKKAKLKRRRMSYSFGHATNFEQGESPFSLGENAVTPLSNASDRNLKSIKPFSEEGSPEIRVKLFTDEETKKTKLKKSNTLGDSLIKFSSPKPIKKRMIEYKNTPTADTSVDPAQTDNDATFYAVSDKDESTYDAKMDITALSHADEILKDASSDSEQERGLRRSKRRRFKPLAWYKGEHYTYERRESGVGLVMPVVTGIERAGTKTPLKPERKSSKRKKSQRPLSKHKLPKGFKYDDGEWADNLFDDTVNKPNRMNIICRANQIEHRTLPAMDGSDAGYAGQSFNLRCAVPFGRWISGRLGLPPGAGKEAESVGDAMQVFIVMACQPQALEVAFGPASSDDDFFDPSTATRFLLNPGDEFYVPSQNAYFLKNHSDDSEAELRFMIMKPDKRSKKSKTV